MLPVHVVRVDQRVQLVSTVYRVPRPSERLAYHRGHRGPLRKEETGCWGMGDRAPFGFGWAAGCELRRYLSQYLNGVEGRVVLSCECFVAADD